MAGEVARKSTIEYACGLMLCTNSEWPSFPCSSTVVDFHLSELSLIEFSWIVYHHRNRHIAFENDSALKLYSACSQQLYHASWPCDLGTCCSRPRFICAAPCFLSHGHIRLKPSIPLSQLNSNSSIERCRPASNLVLYLRLLPIILLTHHFFGAPVISSSTRRWVSSATSQIPLIWSSS